MANQIGKNGQRVDGRFSNVYDGSIVVDRNEFSNDTQRLINDLFSRDYGITELRRYDMENLEKIVDEQMKLHPSAGTGSRDVIYSGFITPYITKILNDITKQRNDIVNGHHMDERDTLERLDKLSKSAEYLANSRDSYLGFQYVNDTIKQRASQLTQIIKNDIQTLPQYNAQRTEANSRFQTLKAEYERKSAFGKLFAKLTGKTESLEQARAQANAYNSANVEMQKPVVANIGDTQYQFTDITDPNMYHSEQGRSR